MQKNNVEPSKDPLEAFIEKYLEYYEGYLDHLVSDYGIKLSDSVRTKNITEFKLRIKSFENINFIEQLSKSYDILARVGAQFDSLPVTRFKSDIESGKVTILTVFKKQKGHEGEPEIQTVIFVKRKDTFGNFKERVKKLVGDIIPSGTKPGLFPV